MKSYKRIGQFSYSLFLSFLKQIMIPVILVTLDIVGDK
jgi:hypothetical protein